MFDGFAQFLINGINGIAAIGNRVILFAPLEQGNKEEAEITINHEYRNAAVTSAFLTDHRLAEEIKILSALGDTTDKYHKNTSIRTFSKNLFYNYWLT